MIREVDLLCGRTVLEIDILAKPRPWKVIVAVVYHSSNQSDASELNGMLQRFRWDSYNDWSAFCVQAQSATAAIVILGAMQRDHGTGCLSAGEQLRDLVRAAPCVRIVIVYGRDPVHIHLGRAPVDLVLSQANLRRLPQLLDMLLANNARLRLAGAVENAEHSDLPMTIRLAFGKALRAERPPRSCTGFAVPLQETSRELRDILRRSASKHARLKWFVDAAIVMHASEAATRNECQLAAALRLRVSERRLIALRARVLGRAWTWSDMGSPDAVSQVIWSNICSLGGTRASKVAANAPEI